MLIKPAGTMFARACFILVCLAMAGAQTAETRPPKPSRSFPLTKLYDTPGHLPVGKPGELIRSEPFDQYDLPFVVTVRILYHSQSASGSDVAASGVVLTPAGDPPASGWPVIAWAHAFSGAARQCAPSLARNLDYGPSFAMWIGLGYAVVAADYAGLGSDARSSVIDMTSNANDVLNAVKAAHAAVPHLGAKWIALGDSEGAPAVVALDEIQSDNRDGNYLGSIALSGVANAKDVYEPLAKGSDRGRLALLAYAIKTVSPQLDVSDILNAKGISFYDQVSQNCAPPGNSSDDLLKPGWNNNPFVQQFFNRNRVGEKKATAPLLIISGETDPIFPIDLVASAVAHMCKQGDRVQFDHYPNLDRNRVPGESVTEQTSWVRDRFAGKPAPGSCP